jgi:hypothetical protein
MLSPMFRTFSIALVLALLASFICPAAIAAPPIGDDAGAPPGALPPLLPAALVLRVGSGRARGASAQAAEGSAAEPSLAVELGPVGARREQLDLHEEVHMLRKPPVPLIVLAVLVACFVELPAARPARAQPPPHAPGFYLESKPTANAAYQARPDPPSRALSEARAPRKGNA